MKDVRKFEFFNDRTKAFSVVETDVETSPKQIPSGDGRFIRTWVGQSGKYKVAKLKISTSEFVNTLMAKRGLFKLRTQYGQ